MFVTSILEKSTTIILQPLNFSFAHAYTLIFLQVNKYIDIAFNSLDLTVNLQTWVVVFEFFGIGAPAPQPSSSGQTSPVKSFDNIEQPQGKVAHAKSFQI